MCYCDPRVYWTVKLNHISSFEIAKLPPLDFPENLYWGKSKNEYVGKDATEYSWEERCERRGNQPREEGQMGWVWD